MKVENLFMEASRTKMRFQTKKGVVGTEDLWDLSLEDLNDIAKDLNSKVKASGEEDFLDTSETRDDTDFQIVLFVLNTKKEEKKIAIEAAANKIKKQRLTDILAQKQDASLNEMSEEELKTEIAKL